MEQEFKATADVQQKVEQPQANVVDHYIAKLTAKVNELTLGKLFLESQAEMSKMELESMKAQHQMALDNWSKSKETAELKQAEDEDEDIKMLALKNQYSDSLKQVEKLKLEVIDLNALLEVKDAEKEKLINKNLKLEGLIHDGQVAKRKTKNG
tara:strand:+ start:761 stop:1219 length:459 start_codon:yes stop_codon:yes gene_type:complete